MNPSDVDPSTTVLAAELRDKDRQTRDRQAQDRQTEDRRQNPRYTVQVPIEIHPEGSVVPTRLETTDLSRGGCYIQAITPLPVGIRVQATLWLADDPIVIRGRIVTRHPQFGNGIMFVDFEDRGEVVLNRYLDAIIAGDLTKPS